jgi:CheY-like chemotaxis protein
VVIGSLNLLKRRAERGEKDFIKFADSALDGAERAALLTHRLLAFSRQQPLAPQPVDCNKFVAGMSDLLRRTLGETVRVETVLAGGLWRTFVDPSQLESTILNLAVNGRDAMPGGGKLTIETANASLDDAYAAQNSGVQAGQYALVAVTDTGTGMTAEVAAKAFDPFFTTKGVGKGTGLGLSQVFGFVKQSGGHIKIYTEPGQGTAIKIYLPRFFGDDAEPARSDAAAEPIPMGSAETVVLVVEDEPRMLMLAVEAFRDLGYSVLQADGPAMALRVIAERADITLLFTDVVMPEMSGRQLAEAALKQRPDLKIIYTTGFSRNAVIHNGVLDRDVNFLSKPFTLEQLARKAATVLRGR